ncbi:MAG: L,D-transpeptidase family protein [Patescibacteria group bacterium]
MVIQNIEVCSLGELIFKNRKYKVAIGKNGVAKNKEEGDGKTPIGCFKMRKILYRKDKVKIPKSPLSVREIQGDDGWSDDSSSPNYNELIKLPSNESHEVLWREDGVYDLIVPLGYNDIDTVPGKGSAIFMHIAKPEFTPTEGCIALLKEDLLEILKNISKDTLVCVGP